MILIDCNVLIDLFGVGQDWYDWSAKATEDAQATDELAVNTISVAEVAPGLGSLAKFLSNIRMINAQLIDLTPEAAFAAGAAFTRYRNRRRSEVAGHVSMLPDFFIGGHAQAMAATILTRDARFYRAYFPDVPLITPETDQE